MVRAKLDIHRAARASALAAFGLCLAALATGSAQAGQFYGSLEIAMTGVRAEAGGNNGVLTTPTTPNTGVAIDTSPLVAGLLGFEFKLHELIPRRQRPPAWMPDVDLEDWILRSELEVAGARDYDLEVQAIGQFPHRANIEDITLMFNQWVDLPLGHAIEAVVGRVRGIDDLTFNFGLGIGYKYSVMRVNNGVSLGKKFDHGMAWQAGAAFGYPLSDNVVLTGGYRYVGLGLQEVQLRDTTGTQNNGKLKLDVDSHEFRAGVRVHFYSIRFPRGLLEPKRRYAP